MEGGEDIDYSWRRPNARIAFQGELGAFGHEAVQRLSKDARAIPMPTFASVIGAVRNRGVACGVLPVENTIVGAIGGSRDVIDGATDIRVVGDVSVPVRLCILGLPGAQLEHVTLLLSQDVALAQVRTFLRAYPHIATRGVHDTAGAAKIVASRHDVTVAAVASERAAAQYGLDVLAAGVEDVQGNATRFAVITVRS